jgi:hypothetical protein
MALAPALGLPLIAKDTIKQALMTVVPVPDVATSRTVGRASVAALLAVAAQAPGAVLESVWHRSYAAADLGNLPGSLVEVFCRCDPAVAAERYARRAGTRAAGHFDAERTIEELERRRGPARGRRLAGDRGRHHRSRRHRFAGRADPGGRGTFPGRPAGNTSVPGRRLPRARPPRARLSSVRELVCLATPVPPSRRATVTIAVMAYPAMPPVSGAAHARGRHHFPR